METVIGVRKKGRDYNTRRTRTMTSGRQRYAGTHIDTALLYSAAREGFFSSECVFFLFQMLERRRRKKRNNFLGGLAARTHIASTPQSHYMMIRNPATFDPPASSFGATETLRTQRDWTLRKERKRERDCDRQPPIGQPKTFNQSRLYAELFAAAVIESRGFQKKIKDKKK